MFSMSALLSSGSKAALLVGSEPEALAIDFTDDYFLKSTVHYGSAKIKDRTNRSNNYNSNPYGLLTYTAPSLKMTMGPNRPLRFQAHNFLTYSQEFDNAAWTKSEATAGANVTTAPDGTATADSLVESTSNSQHWAAKLGLSIIAGVTYTFSVYAKANGRDWCVIGPGGHFSATEVWFDLSSGSVGSVVGSPTTSITDVGGGWYLCSVTVTASSTGAGGVVYIKLGDSDGSNSYTGDGSSGVYLWGAQLRRTPSDDTYLATTSAARYALPYEYELGMLVEPEATNWVTYSADMTNAAWIYSGIGYELDAITEDTEQTALLGAKVFKLTPNTNHDMHRARNASALTATVVTISAIVKPNGYTQVGLRESNTTGAGCVFLLEGAGSAYTPYSSGAFTASNPVIEQLPNGFYRIAVTITAGVEQLPNGFYRMATNAGVGIYVINGSYTSGNMETFRYAGNGSSGVFATLPQLETGSVATSPIPTYGSAVTRAPRYDPPYVNSLGLLVEEARTNLFSFVRFNAETWFSAAGSVKPSAPTVTGPDGLISGWLLEDNNVGGTNSVTLRASVYVATSTVYTFSVYAKAGQASWMFLYAGNFTTPVDGSGVYFNLATGEKGTESAGITGAISDAGNGWYRCSITFTTDIADTFGTAYIAVAEGDGTGGYANADGTSNIYVYGPQFEAGAFATSHIPTYGSAVTRAADNISLATSAFPHSATNGTLYVAYNPKTITNTNVAATLGDGTLNERFSLFAFTSGHLFVRDGGVTQADIDAGTITAAQTNKHVAAWAANDFAASVNGGAAVTDASGTLPTVTNLYIGHNGATASELNGHIKQLMYLPRRVSNANMQTLTSTGALP